MVVGWGEGTKARGGELGGGEGKDEVGSYSLTTYPVTLSLISNLGKTAQEVEGPADGHGTLHEDI